MTVVRHEDLRALGYCNPGARAWFRRRGLSWHELLRHGIPASELEALAGDVLVDRAIERARAREARGRTA